MNKAWLFVLIATCCGIIGNGHAIDVFNTQIPDVGKFRNCQLDINCTSTQDCSAIQATRDTRNCNTCLLKNPFTGACVQRGNDPFCEAAKARQSASYDLEAASRKLDCERAKSMSVQACEASAAAKRGNCEAIRQEEISQSVPELEKLSNFLKLTEGVEYQTLEKHVIAFISSKIKEIDVAELKFYRAVDTNRFLYNFFSRIAGPDMIIDTNSLPHGDKIFDDTLPMVANTVIIRPDYRLTIADVIRASVSAVFYKNLGLDGVAQVAYVSGFNVNIAIDSNVNTICTNLKQEKAASDCNTLVVLVRE